MRRPGTVFELRPCRNGDEEAIAAVLRASIEVLCLKDHGGDRETISRWLANKTPEGIRSWIETSGYMIVAEENGRIIGVEAVASSGEITLNYVSPEARFRGVSKAILHALEDHLRMNGHKKSILFSTRTALQFYCAAGYDRSGDPGNWSGLTAFPMAKEL